MQLKQMGIALIAAGVLSANVHAKEAAIEQITAQPQAAFTETDLSALFEQDAQPMQLAALSQQEMMDTEGAWVWWAVGGLAGGLANSAYYIGSNPTWSTGGLGYAFLTGTSAGLMAGLPGSNLARLGWGTIAGYTSAQPWGGYSWSRW